MVAPRRLPMGLHLPGLLQILSEHLYSDPRIALREALQNAHDSIGRRRAEDPGFAEEGNARIEIRVDREAGALEIHDTGSGLTEDEVQKFLATLGRSYTGELRQSLEATAIGEDEVSRAAELIGQFGLGLLSGFLLSERLELHTRSFRSGARPLLWRSDGSQEYELEEGPPRPVGSRLRMVLRPSARFLLDPGELERTVRHYTEFLPAPIVLEPEGVLLSSRRAPWHSETPDEEAARAFVREEFGIEPLTVLLLSNCVSRVGRSTRTIPLRGLLFVPPASITSLQEFGDVRVYVRRMLLSSHERDLLPPWARFVRGVVESPRLRPTVSRESLRQDDLFLEVRESIGQQLLDHLRDLAEHRPSAWRELVLGHNDLLKGWALKEPELFRAVADLVHFRTSRGRLDLPSIREQNQGPIAYFTEQSSSNQERMLYEASGRLVIDASHFAEAAFLEAYARSRPDVELEQLRPGARSFFQPAPERVLKDVVAYLRRARIEVGVVRFEPADLPALWVFPPDHDRLRRMAEDLEQGEVEGPLSVFLGDYLRRRSSGESTAEVLHLNAANPLLRRIEALGPGAATFGPALDILVHTARFLAGKSMSPDQSRESFSRAMEGLSRLLRPDASEP